MEGRSHPSKNNEMTLRGPRLWSSEGNITLKEKSRKINVGSERPNTRGLVKRKEEEHNNQGNMPICKCSYFYEGEKQNFGEKNNREGERPLSKKKQRRGFLPCLSNGTLRLTRVAT